MKLFHFWFVLSRPMTLGARVVAQNEQGKIALVKHTYVPGWHLPGGGVDNGESCAEAALRELGEETGLKPESPLRFFGIYFNKVASKRDHVTVYQCQVKANDLTKVPDKEIADIRFFRIDDLPNDTSAATRRRLAEVFDGAEISPFW